MANQYRSRFMGSDPVHGSEGAVEMSGFENPPTVEGVHNKHTDMNPQIVGHHDHEDAAKFQTNDDDVPGSHKGQGGHAAGGSPISKPVA